MWQRNLKTAWRNLARRKLYSGLSIGGLALALACVIIVIQFVRHEYGYDRFQENRGRIYRLARLDRAEDGREYERAFGTSPQAVFARDRLPEVERAVRVVDGYRWAAKSGDIEVEGRLRLVDPGFVDVFSYTARRGDLRAALLDPSAVTVTRDFAARLFGSDDPLGRIIRWRDRADLRVAAVLDDPPGPSYLTFDLIGSTLAVPAIGQGVMEDGSYWAEIYLLLKKGTSAAETEAKLMGALGDAWRGDNPLGQTTIRYRLQPLSGLHLDSRLFDEPENTSDRASGTVLAALAAFLLFLASANYVNLAAAQGLKRTKEVGVRKTLGAGRLSIIACFLTESLLCSLAGVLLAVMLAHAALPIFNALAGTRLSLDPLRDPGVLVFLPALALFVGLTAGLYPAAVLSAFRPASIFRGMEDRRVRRVTLRKALLVFQFGISAVLSILITVVMGQIGYMRASARRLAPPGTIDIQVRPLLDRAPAFKTEILRLPGVEAVSLSVATPDQEFEYTQPVLPEGAPVDQMKSMIVTWVDDDFFEVFPAPFVAGGNFPGPSWAGGSPAVINRAAARELGWSDPVGKRLRLPRLAAQMKADPAIIGVVEDFHMESMRKTIRPMMFCFADFRDSYFRASVRLSRRDMSETLAAIEAVWKDFAPGRPFSFLFMDDKIEKLYEQEIRSGRIIGFTAGLAIAIACLGLFGMSAFVAESRTKENGVRKTLGASTCLIVAQLSGQFLRLVSGGIALAIPAAYILSRRWLSGFAYRIPLGPAVFLPAVLLTVLVAWLSVSSQTIKAARTDPVKSLRYE